MCCVLVYCVFFFFKQKTAYEMRISDWSSDVCSSDLECKPLSFLLLSRRSRLPLQPGLPLRRGAGWRGRSEIDGLARAGRPSAADAPKASGAALGGPPGAVDFASGTKGQQPLVFPVSAGLRGRAPAPCAAPPPRLARPYMCPEPSRRADHYH